MTSPELRAQHLQADGQTLYRKGRYEAAFLKFSDALSAATSSTALQINILDNRAATQEKLGSDHFRAALRDARKMMLLRKASAKGYLRAGKILQLMGKYEVALDTYMHGVKQVPTEDQEGRRALLRMHEKVANRVGSLPQRNCVDPLKKLPYELVGMILQYLPFDMLMVSQRVCRGWRQFLLSYSRTYVALDFSATKRPVSRFTLKTYLQRARSVVAKIILKKAAFFDGESLLEVSRRCRKLSELRLSSPNGFANDCILQAMKFASNLTILELGCETTNRAVSDIVKHASKLCTLRCQHVVPSNRFDYDRSEPRALKSLSLEWRSLDDFFPHYVHSDFDKLLGCLPGLQNLELVRPQPGLLPVPTDLSELRSLEVLLLTGSDLWAFPKLPDSLIRLDLSNNASLRYNSTRDTIPSRLEALSIASNPRIGNEDVLDMLGATSESKSLVYLDLGGCPQIDADSLDWLMDAGHGKNLEFLSLKGNQTFGDQVTKELGRMINLTSLNVGGTKISGVGVVNLISRKNNRLQWLGLDNCSYVGRDAIETVIAEGIEVSCRMAEWKGGRKVRY